MDDDIDIYEDLPSFDAKESEKYKEEIKELSQTCNNFHQENTELKLKVAELSESNKSLSVNLSSLLKTAKAEIGRKDRMITELRQRIDNMAFRRTKPQAQKYPNKPANDNTYTPFIRQEPFYVPPTQPAPHQDNTYTSFLRQEPLPLPHTEPASHQEFDEEIDEPEQKYEPEKIATTVFGERLRKKILIEQEVERIRKEEAKRVMLENNVASVKTEVEATEENAVSNNLVKNEPQEVSNSFVEDAAVSIKSAPVSNCSSFNSYEDDDRNLSERRELSNNLLGKRFNKDVLFSEHKRRRIEDERYHSDDMRYYNGNVQHEGRFNQESNENCRNSRNTANHISRRRGSDNREDFERGRRVPAERSKSNHRSRSRSPDRRYVEKRADRHRTDKYRAYIDQYAKRQHSGLNRNKDYCNKFSKDAHDLREKINRRVGPKIGGRNEYNNYKNSKLSEECKRGRHESSPSAKSRTRSNGRIRDKPDDKIRVGRSKSSNRLANIWEEASESDEVKMRLKETKSSVDDRRKVDDEFKLEKSPRTSCEKEITNKQFISSALLPDVSEKKDSDQQHSSTTRLPDALASIPKSNEVPEDIRKLRKGVKTKSKESAVIEKKNHDSEPKIQMSSKPNSEEEMMNKQIASSELLPSVSEKKVTNQTLASTAEVPIALSSAPKSGEVPEELKKQLKGARTRSKDFEPTIHEERDRDSVPKSQIPSRKSSEKEVTKKLLVSLELLPNASTSTPESHEAPERLKKQRKDGRRKSKDSESTILEEKNPDFELKSQIKTRQSSEKEVTNKQLHSPHLLSEVSKKDVKNQQLAAIEQSSIVSTSESHKVPEEIKIERKGARRRSKDPEPAIAEEKNRDSKEKSQVPSHKSSEKEVTNKQLASPALLPEASTKEVTNLQLIASTKLPDDLMSAPKSSEVPEEIKKQRKSSRAKSKDPAVHEHKDRNSKSNSPPTRKSSTKEATNETLATTTELPDISNFASGSRDAPEEAKKQQKSGKRKSKDLKSTVIEEKDCDSEPKSQSATRTNSEKDETNEQLASCVEDLISKLESDGISDEQKDLNVVIAKPIASLPIDLKKVDNPGELISFVLENDADIPSIPLETLTPSDVGSRSFREEKIENIEKFIQNYQDDEDLCCPIPKRGPEDLDYGSKSCDSTSSILDTLSMDIDVVANCKPEDALLDNSLISEQLLLESLSTPIKKNNPPLPPLPPPDVIKPPPLPPSSPPEEIKQPPLPPNSPPEDTKQPPLPPKSPPEEMEIQSSPPRPSSDEKQQNPSPLPSPDETKQNPSPLPSPDETKQNLSSLPSPDETKQNLPPLSSPDETKQNFPPLSSPDETKQNLPPLSSPNETKQNLPPLSSPDETKQNLPPLPSSDETNQNLPPLSSPDETKQNLPPLPSPDETKQNLPPLPSPDATKQNLLPLPSPDVAKQNLPPLPSPDETKQNLPPLSSPIEKKQNLPPLSSPDDKKQALPPLPSPDKSKRSSPPLSSPDKNQQSPLQSHETKNRALPPLPSSDKEIEPCQPLTSSDDKKQRLSSPHPSPDHKKRRLLSSLTSSDDKKPPPSPPLHTRPEEKSAPALQQDTKSEKEKTQPLSLTPVDKSKPILLVQPAPSQKDELRSLLPPAQSEKEDLQLSVIPALSEEDNPLLSTPEAAHEKDDAQLVALPASSRKDNLPLSLLPNVSEKQNLQVCALVASSKKEDLPLPSSTTSSDQKDTIALQPPAPVDKKSQHPAPANIKSHPPAPANKESQPLAPVINKSQPPSPDENKSLPTAPVDKKSQPPAPPDKKSQPPVPAGKKSEPTVPINKKSQPPTPADKKSQPPAPPDKKSQPPVPAGKKSEPTVPINKKSQPPTPADKKSQPTIPIDKKSQSSILIDKNSQPTAPVDKKSQPPVPTDQKSQSPARSEKMDPPLLPTDGNSLSPVPSEEKDVTPAPIHKIIKISETKETFARKPEPEKPRPEKVTLKAISRRHRATCNPIVSRYSRKKRDMVLTDSDAGRCIFKSDSSSDTESNNNANVEIKTPPFITKEAKVVLKQIKTSEPKDTSLENSIRNPTSKIEKSEKLSTTSNICSTENASKMKSDIPNATPELQKSKNIDSIPEIIPPMLPGVEIPNLGQNDNNSGESQPQLESKKEASPKPLNPESSDVIEKPICLKPAETRGTRSALKTIATPGPGGESSSVGTNRKKPLTKEKENQSKQVAKPCKIMVVARRRRPVTLEDSSTATTLVSSAQEMNCDRPSNNNSIKNTSLSSEKSELVQTVSDFGSKGRKRRSADK